MKTKTISVKVPTFKGLTDLKGLTRHKRIDDLRNAAAKQLNRLADRVTTNKH